MVAERPNMFIKKAALRLLSPIASDLSSSSKGYLELASLSLESMSEPAAWANTGSYSVLSGALVFGCCSMGSMAGAARGNASGVAKRAS